MKYQICLAFLAATGCFFIGCVDDIPESASEHQNPINTEVVESTKRRDVYRYDLGAVRSGDLPGDLIRHQFSVANNTSKVFKLRRHSQSCSCIQFEIPESIPSGGTGNITVWYSVRDAAEQRDEYVQFTTENSTKPFVACCLRCFTVPRIEIQPTNNVSLVVHSLNDVDQRGTLLVYAREEELSRISKPTARAPEGIECIFGDPTTIQIAGGLQAIRIPFVISANPSLQLLSTSWKHYLIQLSVAEDFQQELQVGIRRKSTVQFRPRVLVLDRRNYAKVELRIQAKEPLPGEIRLRLGEFVLPSHSAQRFNVGVMEEEVGIRITQQGVRSICENLDPANLNRISLTIMSNGNDLVDVPVVVL